MTDNMAAAVAVVRDVLPPPFRLSDASHRVLVYGGSSPTMFEVVDDRGERVCDLVIAYEPPAGAS